MTPASAINLTQSLIDECQKRLDEYKALYNHDLKERQIKVVKERKHFIYRLKFILESIEVMEYRNKVLVKQLKNDDRTIGTK